MLRRSRRAFRTLAVVATLAPATPLAPRALHAQGGPGSTGAAVLQLPAGSRAAALSGAYAAAVGDVDALFYNPAGAAGLDLGISLAYQRHVEEILVGSAAGAVRIGSVVLGLATAYFDAGEVHVLEPDPAYGGQRGRETGETAGARESATRITLSVPLGALRLGAGAGFLTSDLAGVSRSAYLFDLGAQYDLPGVTLGAAIRNLGGSATGSGGDPIPLPTEARLGATAEIGADAGLGLVLGADLAADLKGGTTYIVTGLEGGLLPRTGRRVGAVARVGLDTRGRGDDGLAPLRFGLGIAIDRIAVDYTYQDLEFFGAVHRVGVRWSRAAP